MRGLSDSPLGARLLGRFENSLQQAIRGCDFPVCKTKRLEALLYQPRIANGVMFRIVKRAVDLDGQPGAKAHEVYDIGAERKLTSELQSGKSAAAQQLPKTSLVRWRAPPQGAGLRDGRGSRQDSSRLRLKRFSPPHPTCCAGHLLPQEEKERASSAISEVAAA
jgi:hypothetical protein